MHPLVVIALVIVALIALGWLGLQIQPQLFAMPNLPQAQSDTIPLPAGLPQPVERFYRTVYGEQIPVIQSAVFIGRARIRPFGIWLPARFVFVHDAGHAYRHYIEATFFGLPFLKVNEGIVGSESFFESPMGTYYNDANTNQGANLALWVEAGWFPSLWLTDPRVRWEAVDENTALLFVPFDGREETFVARFNPQTGLIDTLEAIRYRDPGEGRSKILWITRNEPGRTLPGSKVSAVGSATWLDQGQPWAIFTLEEAVYNVDVHEYLNQRGQ